VCECVIAYMPWVPSSICFLLADLLSGVLVVTLRTTVTIRTPLAAGRNVCYRRRLENWLGFVDIEFLPPPPTIELSAFVKVSPSRDLWHTRLGHASEASVKLLASSCAGMPLSGGPFSTCEACIIGKHTQQPHPPSTSRASLPLELVHSDLCGPFPVQTPHGKLYFIIFLDDHLNALDLQLLATKDQALDAFRVVHPHWEKKYGHKLKTLRTDNGGEFLGNAFTLYLVENGIERQLAAPYAHQQNGRAERVIRTIEGRVLSMMAAVGAPRNLWGEASLACAYLFMFTPSSVLPRGCSCGVLDWEAA